MAEKKRQAGRAPPLDIFITVLARAVHGPPQEHQPGRPAAWPTSSSPRWAQEVGPAHSSSPAATGHLREGEGCPRVGRSDARDGSGIRFTVLRTSQRLIRPRGPERRPRRGVTARRTPLRGRGNVRFTHALPTRGLVECGAFSRLSPGQIPSGGSGKRCLPCRRAAPLGAVARSQGSQGCPQGPGPAGGEWEGQVLKATGAGAPDLKATTPAQARLGRRRWPSWTRSTTLLARPRASGLPDKTVGDVMPRRR